MKKILIIVASFSLLSTSCHYGEDAANDSLKRNDKYKEIKNENQAPTPGDDYLESQGKTPTDSTSVKVSDTTAK